MDYMREINAFYDRLETNPLAASGIVLWHALMSIANKARWPDKFVVAVSVLQGKTGLKRDAIYDARNLLQQQGLIIWKSRNGNQSAEYALTSCVGYSDTPTHSEPTHRPTQNPLTNPPLTTYPTDTPYTKTKTKTKTKNEGPAPSAEALDLNPSGSEGSDGSGPKKPGDAALIRQAVSDFTQNDELRDALLGWIDMRKKMRKPLTARAMELALKGLAETSCDTRTRIEIVNEAITRSWLKFYPLTDKGGARSADVRPDDKQPYELSGITRF